MAIISRLLTSSESFWSELKELLAWESVSDEAVFNTVKDIIRQVRADGDAAVLEFTQRFDGSTADSFAELEISQERLAQALKNLPTEQRAALEQAADRIPEAIAVLRMHQL